MQQIHDKIENNYMLSMHLISDQEKAMPLSHGETARRNGDISKMFAYTQKSIKDTMHGSKRESDNERAKKSYGAILWKTNITL